MSRSYKKNPYYSCDARTFKEWKQTINQAYRTACKQLINTTEDWDAFILPPHRDSRDRWNYPKEDRRRRQSVPAINQCEVDVHEWRHSPYSFYLKRLNEDGHLEWCNCYTNKRSKYWKMMRK